MDQDEDTPEVESTEVESTEVESPEVESPEVESPEVEPPEVESPKLEEANREEESEDIDHTIRYKVEYRHPITDKVIATRITDRLGEENHDEVERQPVFEIVTTYKTRIDLPEGPSDDAGFALPQRTTLDPPRYHMKIYSPAIINALRSVVKYYPSQDLTGDPMIVRWPYPVLVHHYQELNDFKAACTAKEPEDLCIREHDAPQHIRLLLDFLDREVMEEVRKEQQRNEKGVTTWEYYWVSHKPGTFRIAKHRQGGVSTTQAGNAAVHVIHSISGGTFGNGKSHWSIKAWRLAFDGEFLNRVRSDHDAAKFDGENPIREILEHHQLSEKTRDSLSESAREQYRLGKLYYDLLQKQCRFYKGKTENLPQIDVEGLVMPDLETYYAAAPKSKPTAMDTSDLRNWTSDCSCLACKNHKESTSNKVVALFEDLVGGISVKSQKYLKFYQYLLLPQDIVTFVFATRSWQRLHVDGFSEPDFQENMIQNLVMEPRRKSTLMALTSSFTRLSKSGEQLSTDMWAADFVKGKGSGLIFLLHGQPGVGKTHTAECIAASTKRPLMTLTASDIGTDPIKIEGNLTRHFRRAKSWGAVLLIDEADIFMERRTSSDLVRNSLVAGFLRALEYYDGILFLTTNRVGAFDDAFISRIHIQLYYKPFGEEDRRAVWQTFVDKLSADRGKYIRLNVAAKEYIFSKGVCSMNWSGREIRNAFQTAVALAEFHGEKDEEGTILVTDENFKPVIELSKDFNAYLDELHKRSQPQRAEVNYERLDSFKSV